MDTIVRSIFLVMICFSLKSAQKVNVHVVNRDDIDEKSLSRKIILIQFPDLMACFEGYRSRQLNLQQMESVLFLVEVIFSR